MPEGVSRWHLVSLKNCLPARYVKLATVHGAPARSSSASTTPRFVVIVIVEVPDLGMFFVGGLPTSLTLSDAGTVVHAQSAAAAAVFLPPLNPPAAQTTPTTIRITASPAPTDAWSWRRRRAAAARPPILPPTLAPPPPPRPPLPRPTHPP